MIVEVKINLTNKGSEMNISIFFLNQPDKKS